MNLSIAMATSLQQLYCSPTSTVMLVRLGDVAGKVAVLKARRTEKAAFLAEVRMHRRLAEASRLFPEVIGSDEMTQRLVLELCECGSAADLMKTNTDFWDGYSAVLLVSQLLTAVKAMHERKFAHCDIHPRHVLLSSATDPKLTGFRCAVSWAEQTSGLLLVRKDLEMLGRAIVAILVGDEITVEAQIIPQLLCKFPDVLVFTLQEMVDVYNFSALSASDVLLKLGTVDLSELSWSSSQSGLDRSWRENRSLALFFGGEACHGDSKEEKVSPEPSLEERMKSVEALAGGDEFAVEGMQEELRKLMACARVPGEFKVTLRKGRTALCVGGCRPKQCASSLVALECQHSICRQCLNRLLKAHLHSCESYSAICCPRCKQSFSPLVHTDSLESELVTTLTELKLNEEMVVCPKCTSWLDVENSLVPVSHRCPMCKHKFCSYCRKKSHFFRCSQFEIDKGS